MSDTFKYKVGISPSPTTVEITLGTDGTKLNATVTSVPDLSLTLTPTGTFVQKIMSGILWPLAAIIAAANKSKLKTMIEGQSQTIVDVTPYTTNGITITAGDLALGSCPALGPDTPMLEATGTLTLSPAQ